MTNREKVIALIDNDSLQVSDAIVLLEGDGLNRYQKAVELYNQKLSTQIIFSGGITDYEYGSYPFSDVFPQILIEGIPKEGIIHEDKSQNTQEQAIEVVNIALENKWHRLILIASHEHQYRAYLTFLRVVIDKYPSLILFNAPVRNLKWFLENRWGSRFARLEMEFDKIEKYSLLGHLATFEEAIEYQKWKELQL
jgi:uncharacterized SAM-binding protein YcdF (DUF218 family)